MQRGGAEVIERVSRARVGDIALEIDEEHVLEGPSGPGTGFELGHGVIAGREDAEGSHQRAVLVPGDQDQAGLAGSTELDGDGMA